MTLQQPKRRALLALASVCLAGAALGAAGVYSFTVRGGPGRNLAPAEYRTRLLNHLTEDLELDIEQREQIAAILDEIGERYQSVREAIEPELEAIRRQRADRIMSVLYEDQQVKYEKILEERRRRREQSNADALRQLRRH